MIEIKLKKINERLYKEGSLKWPKRLRNLFLTLTNIQVDLHLGIYRPKNSLAELQKDLENEREDEKEIEPENTKTSRENETEESYSENFGWRIRATGHFDDKIGLIKEDGTNTDHLEHFSSVDMFLCPVSDTDKEKVFGNLRYDDAKFENREKPYLYLYLYVPEKRLESLCNELVSGRLSFLEVGVDVDLFQSEVDSSLWEPPMLQNFYLEKDQNFNRAYLSFLTGSRSIGSGTLKEIQIPDNPKELFEKEGLSEKKINFIGKRLLDTEEGFINAVNKLKNTIVVLAIIYVVWSFFVWLSRQ